MIVKTNQYSFFKTAAVTDIIKYNKKAKKLRKQGLCIITMGKQYKNPLLKNKFMKPLCKISFKAKSIGNFKKKKG